MLARYGVLWYWEAYINQLLCEDNLVFDKLISIKKTPHGYVGFFTVNDPELYGQIIVSFTKKTFKICELILRSRKGPLIMKHVYQCDSLIFDKRHEFDWISS
jgi:hypothetical protein